MGEDVIEELAHLSDHLVRAESYASRSRTAIRTSTGFRSYIEIIEGARTQAPMFVFYGVVALDKNKSRISSPGGDRPLSIRSSIT